MSEKFLFGVVEDILDPLNCCRARVRIFGIHTDDKSQLPTDKLPWALPILPLTSSGISGIGLSSLGIVCGSHVRIEFMDKYQQQPVMTGVLPGVPQLNSSINLSSNNTQSLIGLNSFEKNATLTTIPPSDLNNDMYVKTFTKVITECNKWGITADEKIKYVVATIMAIAGGECGFKNSGLEEQCYYSSAVNLVQTFKVFKTTADALPYTKMTSKATFFEKVYGVESGKGKQLGNTKSTDGGKYYGRGLIQITGKSLYQSITNILNKRGYSVDFVKTPDSIIDDEYLVPATFAFFEKKGLFKNIDNIGYSWFEIALVATGKDVAGSYNKKRNYYKHILQVSNIQSSPTTLRVGNVGPLSYSAIQEIRARQISQSKNIVNSELKSIATDYTNDKSVTANITSLQSTLDDKIKNQKDLIKQKLAAAFLSSESLSVLNGGSDILKTLSASACALSDVSEWLDGLTNKLISAVNDEITQSVDDIVDTSNSLFSQAQESIMELINSGGGIYAAIFAQINSIIDSVVSNIQSMAITKTQSLLGRLDNPLSKINNAIQSSGSNLPPPIQSLISRIHIPNARQLASMYEVDISGGIDALYESIALNIGYSDEQLEAMSDKREINNEKGFLDPNGKYPLRETVGEPFTNKLARGKFDGTVVEWKLNTSLKNIPVGGVNNDEFLLNSGSITSWSVPSPSIGGEYPYTKVNQTESGHIFIVDDTPGKETISNNHRSGTYEDTYANGVNVKRIIGDGYQIIDRNGFVYIAGRLTMNIMDGSNIMINGNCYMDVHGSYNVRASGGINFDAESDINMKSKGNINIEGVNLTGNVSESVRLKANQNILMESANAMSFKTINLLTLQSQANLSLRSNDGFALNVKGKADINSNKSLTLSSKEMLQIKGETGITIASPKTIDMKATTKFNLESGSDFNIKSGGKINNDSTTDINIKAGSNVNVDGLFTWLQSGKATSATSANIEDFNAIENDAIQPLNIADLKMSIFFVPEPMSMPQLATPALGNEKADISKQNIIDGDKK